jgi:hypothetical protein
MLLKLGGPWIMRPIPFFGLAVIATLATVPALADTPFPSTGPNPTGAGLQVKAPSGYHLNPGYHWKICAPKPDGTCGAILLDTSGFSFSDKTDHPASATFTPVAGLLKGGYCQDGGNGCNAFKATCTATACTGFTSNF